MGGQPTAIRGTVVPGQTYDVYVDLIAPESAGEYVGYWHLHNTSNQAFGQTIWVAVEVLNSAPEVPTATITPGITLTAPTATVTPTPPEEAPPPPTATEEAYPAPPTATEEAYPAPPTATEDAYP